MELLVVLLSFGAQLARTVRVGLKARVRVSQVREVSLDLTLQRINVEVAQREFVRDRTCLTGELFEQSILAEHTPCIWDRGQLNSQALDLSVRF